MIRTNIYYRSVGIGSIRMRIESIEVTPVRVPLENRSGQPLHEDTPGGTRPYRTRRIAGGRSGHLGQGRTLYEILSNELTPMLEDQNPFSVSAI